MGGKEVHREYTHVNVHEQQTKEEEEMNHIRWIHESNLDAFYLQKKNLQK
jgi:hypothetical protein